MKIIRQENTPIARKLFKQANQILKLRQVSACEAAHRLCHLKLRQSSRGISSIITHRPSERYKSIRYAGDQAEGFCSSLIDRYINRPVASAVYDFAAMPLLEFAVLFVPIYNKNVRPNEDEEGDLDAYDEISVPEITRSITLLNHQRMRIRKKPTAPRYYTFIKDAGEEAYYYSKLMLYVPFRAESELMQGHETAKSAFLAKERQLLESNNKMATYIARDEELEKVINQLKAFLHLANDDDDDDEEQVNENEVVENVLNAEDFRSACTSMNGGHKELYNYITRSIAIQLKGSEDRIRLFVTGGAGSGKTFTLKILKHQIYLCYGSQRNTVKVAAFTGVAARLVNGLTLHSLIRFKVQRDRKIPELQPLSSKSLKFMRNAWQNTRFLIIDEISLVSYDMFNLINLRLQELKNNNEHFGGVN